MAEIIYDKKEETDGRSRRQSACYENLSG